MPEKPPKQWWERCIIAVSKDKEVTDPKKVCGWVWNQHSGAVTKKDILAQYENYKTSHRSPIAGKGEPSPKPSLVPETPETAQKSTEKVTGTQTLKIEKPIPVPVKNQSSPKIREGVGGGVSGFIDDMVNEFKVFINEIESVFT